MDILGLLLSGGATGIFGSIVSQALGIWKSADERKTRALEMDHEVKLQEMQLASLKQETEREVFIAEQKATTDSYTAALDHDSNFGKTSWWVANVRAMVTPAITFALIFLTALIYFTTSEQRVIFTISDTVVFSMITVMSYWFGNPNLAKQVTGYRKLPWN